MARTVIDWFDERLGVKEFYEKHIAYPLPQNLSFWHLFGGLIIGCVMIQFLTGFYMLFYYIPDPELAHQSIREMCNTTTFGALFRNVHRWSATMGILFLVIHMVHVMARRAYLPPRELNWWTGLTLGFIFILLLITGVIMPWDWRSYWELVIWADWVGTIPVVGEYLKQPLVGSFSMGRNFAFHIFLLPILIVGVIFVHIVIFRRLGLSDNV